MKNFLTLSILMLTAFAMHAQTAPKHEIGVVFSSLNQFGISYKKQTKNQRYWHFGAAALRGQSDSENFDQSIWQFGTNVHLESRKDLTEKFQFIHGPGIFFNASLAFQNSLNEYIFSISPNYGLGFRLKLSNEIAFTAAVYPSVNVEYRRTVSDFNPTEDLLRYRLNLSSSSAQIGIFYNLY